MATPAELLRDPYFQDPTPSICARGCNALGRGIGRTAHFIYEVISNIALYLLFGVIAHFGAPVLAPSFYCFVGSTFATRLVLKLLDRYHFRFLNKIKLKASNCMHDYPTLLKASFIASTLLFLVSPIAGGAFSAFFGTIHGVGMEIKVTKPVELPVSHESDDDSF